MASTRITLCVCLAFFVSSGIISCAFSSHAQKDPLLFEREQVLSEANNVQGLLLVVSGGGLGLGLLQQQQQPTPQWTEMAANGGILGGDRSGERNLIRPNEVLYQLVVVFIIIMVVQTCGFHLMLFDELCFTVLLLVKSSRALITICSVLLLLREYKIRSDASNPDVRCNIGNGGRGERQEGGTSMEFTRSDLSSKVTFLLHELSQKWYSHITGGRRAGGGGVRSGDGTEAMAAVNNEITGAGNGGQGGGGSSGGIGLESGRGGDRNLGLIVHFSKLSNMSITVAAQTTSSIIAFHFGGPSSSKEILLVSVMVCNLLAYLCCLSCILQNQKRPWVAGILGGIGSAASALGYILMIALAIPEKLLWIVGLACFGLLLAFVTAFV